MSESVVLVCDVCGHPATVTVPFTMRGQNWQKDLCDTHAAELLRGARTPRRGRRRAAPPPEKKQATPAQLAAMAKARAARKAKATAV